MLRRDCRLIPPQTRGSRSAFAVVSQRPANHRGEWIGASMHGIALQVIRSPVHHLTVNSKSLMNLEAVRGLNGKGSTWPVPVSVPHQKSCTVIDTLLTFIPHILCASGLSMRRYDAVTYHYSNRKHVSKKNKSHLAPGPV